VITQERLKELFKYDNGNLIWDVNKGVARKGKVAGSLNKYHKYIEVGIDGKLYGAHRLVFLFHHGYLPKQIDHRNRNKSDNRIDNLRICTTSQNQCNREKKKSTTSKYKGVCWNTKMKLWGVDICVNENRMKLGYFWDEETAAQVVRVARVKLHGEFANHG